MSIPEDKLRFCFYYILKYPNGYKEALDCIHKDIYDYLLKIGYIKSGVDALGRSRYGLTDEGREHTRVSYIAMSARKI